MTINATQALALRAADAICFDLNHPFLPGVSSIRAIIRSTDDEAERQVRIPADHSRVERYDGSGGEMHGFHMEMYVRHDDVMQSILRDLAATGSEFALHWVRGNSSPVLDEAGLVCDELRITVQKKGAKKARTYRVAKQVGKDNSARMIRLG